MLWIILGTDFWAGFYEGFVGIENYYDSYTDRAIGFGFIVAIFQSILTIGIFIVALLKSIFTAIKLKVTGIWLLVSGIAAGIINIFHLVPVILLVIAGSLAISIHNEFAKSLSNQSNNSNSIS